MSDRIIQGFSEMKQIYLSQIITEEKEEDCEAGEEYEKNYKKTGKKSEKDLDGDGEKEDEADEYAGKIDNAIRKRKEKNDKEDEMKTESFSDWRNDLNEVISKIEPKIKDIDDKQFKEGSVKNKIVLNPPVTENVEIISTEELNEDFIYETSFVAADYFREFGLNEDGLEMVIDHLGEDKFLEYVFSITEDYFLTEERAAKRQKPGGKTVAQVKAEIAAREAKAAAKKAANKTSVKQNVGKAIVKDKGDQVVKAAVQQQEPKKKETVGDAVSKVHRGLQQNWRENDPLARKIAAVALKGSRRHGEAMKAVGGAAGKAAGNFVKGRKSGQTTSQALGSAFRSLFNSFDGWVGGLIEEGYDLSTISAEQLIEQYNFLLEKAVSEHQQKLFGMALSVKRGETPRSEVGSDVLKIVDEMSMGEIRKFAGTKHKDLPATKE
jgi:hypothetical protein